MHLYCFAVRTHSQCILVEAKQRSQRTQNNRRGFPAPLQLVTAREPPVVSREKERKREREKERHKQTEGRAQYYLYGSVPFGARASLQRRKRCPRERETREGGNVVPPAAARDRTVLILLSETCTTVQLFWPCLGERGVETEAYQVGRQACEQNTDLASCGAARKNATAHFPL
jgi:hypothetical protein